MNWIFRSNYFVAAALTIGVLGIAAFILAQQKRSGEMLHDDCPMMKTNVQPSNMTDHDQMVMENGEKAMGFSQTATTHHFLLMPDGGAIRVTANDKGDTENRDKIRSHLSEIAKQFKDGIFTTPFAVHGRMPPGVPEMDRLKDKIDYHFEEVENGAQVRITTADATALAAVHDFLKFQINDHKTGDPLTP